MALDCTKMNLLLGMEGDEIKTVQQMLHDLSFYGGKIDGYYGPVSVDAVMQFQRVTYLDRDGNFGPVTCKKLNERYESMEKKNETATKTSTEDFPLEKVVRPENKLPEQIINNIPIATTQTKGGTQDTCTAPVSQHTKTLQIALRRLGYYPVYAPDGSGKIDINGKYCYYTAKAVKDFQEANDLTANGVFNEETKKKLIEKVCPSNTDSDAEKDEKDKNKNKK